LDAVRPGDDTLALLASELAANAVEHAQGWFRVELHANATGLRLIVFDQGSVSLPSRGHAFADPLAERGRGLLLVQNLASAWGVTPLDGGKAVWLDLPRSGASSQGPPLLV